MKLTARQKYDYHDIDRNELFLIKVGHACWAAYQAERRVLGPHSPSAIGILEGCEQVWEAKRKYRLELKARRSEQFKAWRAGSSGQGGGK